jgi:hypothetical protein
MDAFVSRKRRKISTPDEHVNDENRSPLVDEDESTDVKLAILSSLHPEKSTDDLLEILLSCEGSVEQALEAVSAPTSKSPNKPAIVPGIQSALSYVSSAISGPAPSLTKKGRTLHLYDPADIAAHTPCSITHNFLPSQLANDLLNELLPETPTYTSATFRLFDNVVQSPHTAQFYVTDAVAVVQQRQEYLYNGSNLDDVREILPVMKQVSILVREAVNKEIKSRIQTHQDGKKLKFQSPHEWSPNAAFVNCYDGAKQSVGWHTDQLSYLGPRPVIGSLSLGVAREFRVRRIVPPDSPPASPSPGTTSSTTSKPPTQADTQGQISIHLPHNSLLVMHASCQEEWKHSVAPAQTITPHPVAGNKRINITYRWYREEFHPRFTPRCRCGTPCVLKCVMKRKESRGRYMWMCQVGGRADVVVKGKDGQKEGDGGGEGKGKVGSDGTGGCGFFEWAEFTDDGEPIWKHRPRSMDKASKGGEEKTAVK